MVLDSFALAATGLGDDRPLKRQGISIRITGTVSVELHRIIDPYRLIRPGIAHRRRIVGRNRHRIRCAVHRAVVDDQLDRVGTGDIDHKGGFYDGGVGQRCVAAVRFGDKGPLKGQGISIHITGSAAVKLHRVIDQDRLIRSGMATGAEFSVDIVTVSGALFTVPSLTISCTV